MIASIVIFVVGVIASVVLTPLVIQLAGAWGLFDTPHGDRRVHTEPVPRIGGVAVFVATWIALLAMALVSTVQGLEPIGSTRFFFGVLFGGGIIFATGLVDDLRGLRPLAKLLAQLVAAGVVYGYGFQIDVLSIGSSSVELGWAALPLTMFWVVGATNAFNLIDGLDGLATGIALVALTTTVVVAIALGNFEVVLLCMALLGSLVGFFRYNRSPAKIFLGDSGSLFVGFMLAVLSVHGSYKSATAVLVLVPLFALAIPLLDTSLAILRRWLRGVPLSQADGRHIHHRLLALGLPQRHAVTVLHLVAAMLATLGLSLVFAPPPVIVSVSAAGGGVMMFLLIYGLRRLQYHEFVEAASVLTSGIFRLRRGIRHQILAHDVAQVIRQASTVDEVEAILEDHAETFGFLHMEVCRESDPGSRPLVLFDGHAARAWRLDYPVTPHDFTSDNDYVLRVWCNPGIGSRPFQAERVAGILAPEIEEWMRKFSGVSASSRIRVPLESDVGDRMDQGEPAERFPVAPLRSVRQPSRKAEKF